VVTQVPAAAAKYTLVGLLELGDRSAALFEVDGVTQRFSIGEAVGSSGWTLVSVANQEAVIRRNGEVRSVYVGQKF
jgi:Tfp pilus assembly protein PilP